MDGLERNVSGRFSAWVGRHPGVRKPAQKETLCGKIERTGRALRLQRMDGSACKGPFAAIIRCAADPVKADKRTQADKRTRSKWSRVLRYAATYKVDFETLDQFSSPEGGLNACADRFSRCLGRGPH
jgi:hypothetical protein